MGIIAETRPTSVQSPIALQDALRIFRHWHTASVRLQILFVGKSGITETVRVALKGTVAKVDSSGMVTVSGEGRQIRLDLHGCEVSAPGNGASSHSARKHLSQDSAFQIVFPGGATCFVSPVRSDSGAAAARRNGSRLSWLRRKMGRPAREGSPADRPPAGTAEVPAARRNLLIDVRHGQANIVEVLSNGNHKVHRLKEQFLSQASRTQADRLKRQIIYGENGGAYDLAGMYRPRTSASLTQLLQFVEELEQQDGPTAWDRRRYTR
jgi:hypothetical protein